ncbi:MAG: BON domain-containing protein [Candidatus Polarisedimenticolia bacterium]
MQRRLQWLCLTVLACMTLAACASTDETVTANVTSRLAKDDAVPPGTISVETHQGVVTLTGNVDSPEQKARAIEVARTTDGVHDVVDRITAAEDGTGNAPDADRAMGEAADDAAITQQVKASLLDDEMVRGLKIDVDTREGVVYLTGTVASEAEKDRAVELARQAAGGRQVQANLTIQRT